MLIPLSDWDRETFRKPHSMATLYKWATTQQMDPPAEKIGKEWLIEEGAVYVGLNPPAVSEDMPELVRRILNDA